MVAGQVPEWLQEQAREAAGDAMARAWVQEHDNQKQTTSAELAAACGQLPEAFRNQAPIVAEGHAAEEILKVAERESVDLLVIGTHHMSRVQQLLLGSTSEKILAHAPCSVLLVPHHDKP